MVLKSGSRNMNDHFWRFIAFLRLTKMNENTSRNLSAEGPNVPSWQLHRLFVHI